MPTFIPPTEVEVCGSGAAPDKGASREVFRKWIKAYLNLFGASGTPEGACTALGFTNSTTSGNHAIRLGDGTLICRASITFPIQGINTPSTIQPLLLPDSFINANYHVAITPIAQITGSRSDIGLLLNNGIYFTKSVSQIAIQSYAYRAALNDQVICDVLAIGRWRA